MFRSQGIEFAGDSPLKEAGFELLVPRKTPDVFAGVLIDFGYCSAAVAQLPVTSPSTVEQCRGQVAKSEARPHHQKRLFVKQV